MSQNCISDPYGRCVRVITGLAHNHSFDVYHLSVVFLCVAIIYALITRATARMFDDRGAPGCIFIATRFLVAVYLSMVVATLALDHGFKLSQIGAAIYETNHDTRAFRMWVRD